MENVLVSVMFLSYNHGKYIKDTMNSVLNQSYGNFEVILSDDCSTDNSYEILQDYSDSRIHLHRFEKNVGASANHKYIQERCQGKYLALINSDDLWEKNHLKSGVEYLEKNPSCYATFSWSGLIDENGKSLEACCEIFKKENRTKSEWLRYLFSYGNCLCHPSVILRRELYEEIGFYNMAMRQLPDFDLWVRVLKKYDVHILQEVTVQHRRCILSNQNTSAPVYTNSIRDINESSYILSHFWDNLSDQQFVEVFSPLFRNPNAFLHEQIQCEKFFLLFDDKYYMKSISKQFAFLFLLDIYNKKGVKDVLLNEYNFSVEDIYQLGAEIDLYCINSVSNKSVSNVKNISTKKTKSLIKVIVQKILKLLGKKNFS